MSRDSANSWNHTVTVRPVDHWQCMQERCEKYGNGREWVCRPTKRGECLLPTTHLIEFNYVTGRYGSRRRGRRSVCFKHALTFSRRYGVEIQPC